ncbi:hypothetical protein EsH8_II_001239 [Colletotrichum jinshuiense]
MNSFGGQNHYRPLSPSDVSEIRMVKLYPGKFKDEIRCELMHVSLASENAAYIALSVLQDPDLPRGFPFEVGPEFSSMVQRHVSELGLVVDEQDESLSQQTSLDSCYLTFWIDAICINQRDLVERSQQVGKMKDIYSRAHSTLIWLGDAGQPAEDVSLAFDLVRDIWQQIQAHLRHQEQWTEVVDRITSEEFVEPRIPSIMSLRQILTRAWFSRVWIIQEVATAQGPVFALLGFYPVQWKFLSHVVLPCCEYMTRSGRYNAVDAMFRTDVRNVHALRDLAKEYAVMMEGRTSSHNTRGSINAPERFYALLQQTCGSFKATDPHDVVYAILGLLGTDTIPQELLPDYTASVGYVFHQTAVYLVRHLHRIDFLSFSKRKHDDLASVPSWVPDWRYLKMSQIRGYENPLAANVTEDGLGLEIEGIRLGTVATVVYPTAFAAAVANTFIGRREQPQRGENSGADTARGVLAVF